MIPYCKEQKDHKMREARCIKSAVSIYKFLYFVFIITWGYRVKGNSHYLHWTYGGNAKTFDLGLIGYPYQDRTAYP